MGIFRRKKKRTELHIEISEGLRLGQLRELEHQNAFFSCVPKGILVYLVVFGSLGGFISAFNIECNYVIPGIVLLLFALYFSGLFAFKKNRYKDIGYILFFIVYVFGIYLFKAYVNSGFAAIVNMVRQRGEMYFDLNTGTEFAENIEDRYLTVTITFIFIGIFEVLLLNIYISNYMSLKTAVLMAVPMYIIPLYFQVEPDLFFVFCMLCGLVGISIFWYGSRMRRRRRKRGGEKGTPEIMYTQSNRVSAGVLLGAAACVLVVGLFTLFYSQSDFQKQYTENKYKAATRDGVSGFIMIGFRIFFPNYYQSGGMSGGYLGNISALRPQNKTHLVVRYTPYDTEPVYLKAYTGLVYGNNRWLDGYTLLGAQFGKSSYFRVESMEEEADKLAARYQKDPEHNGKGIMEIINQGADVNYLYYPYFTKFKEYEKYTNSSDSFFVASRRNQTERLTYYPNIGYEAELENAETFTLNPDHDSVGISSDDIYREVPADNEEAVDRFLAEAGISKTDTSAVQKVVDYFQEEYSYSYSPGRVPANEDFVNYFLDENKKGVCSHFASAATLIFRRLGIPARYVEGYAFSYAKALSGKQRTDLDYDDYYSGYSRLGKTAVMEVEVTDANAHAWVEIYQEGKGWVVVDPTPVVSDENAGDSRNLWNSVQDFWENSPDLSIDGDISGLNLSFLNSHGVRLVMILVAILVFLVFLGRLAVIRIYHFSRWHTRSYKQNLLWYYGEMCRRKGKKDAEFGRLSVPSDQIHYLAERYELQHEESIDSERLIRIFEEICFGPGEPGEEDYRYVMGMLKKIR